MLKEEVTRMGQPWIKDWRNHVTINSPVGVKTIQSFNKFESRNGFPQIPDQYYKRAQELPILYCKHTKPVVHKQCSTNWIPTHSNTPFFSCLIPLSFSSKICFTGGWGKEVEVSQMYNLCYFLLVPSCWLLHFKTSKQTNNNNKNWLPKELHQ